MSGVLFAGVVERLGIADALRPKTALVHGGGSTGALAAAGQIAMAAQMLGELMPSG